MAQQDTTPVWFITGCSTGFGRELARLVLERGWRAVVAARNPAQVADLVERYAPNALSVTLDVTQPAQIPAVLEQAQSAFGRIDVLVNNAGYGYLGAIEEGEDSEVRAMFETNFFGVTSLVRAVLPQMRARRSGTIVNISSVGGLFAFPGSGYYAASKFALEGFSEALSKEVGPLGVRVLIVEPGPFRTDWAGRSLRRAPDTIADYESTVGQRLAQTSARSGRQPGDPVRAAEAILTVLESPTPPLRLVLGKIGLENVRNKLATLSSELDTWESTTLGADFPEEA